MSLFPHRYPAGAAHPRHRRLYDDVSNAGARYVDEEVVRDGNLITSRKPDDLPAFMQAIIQAVREAKAVPAGAR